MGTLTMRRKGGKVDEEPSFIIYTASAKLAEARSTYGSGLHKNAFGKSITSHTFENGVGTIEFGGCVTSIGSQAFYYCSGLTSITIPSSVTSIGSEAFYYCSGLTSITIPSSVTSIGRYAFSNCSGLTSITIPSSVTSIGDYAFSNCSGLTSITIPSSVTSIGSEAFYYCSGLTSIIVENNNAVFDSRNNCNAIIKTSENALIVGCKNTAIPSSVTSIGDYAFYYCSGLTSITIPNSVTSIGDYAFYYCSGLTSIFCYAKTAPSIKNTTFQGVKTKGILYVPIVGTGYKVWMGTGNYYLGKYSWTKRDNLS